MRKKLLWAVLVISVLCTSCNRVRDDVSNGDEVVISDALQGQEGVSGESGGATPAGGGEAAAGQTEAAGQSGDTSTTEADGQPGDGSKTEHGSQPDDAGTSGDAVETEDDAADAAGTPGNGEKKVSATPQATASATYAPIISHSKVKLYDSTGTAVIGDTGYEIYNYVPSVAESYAKLMNRAGQEFGSDCNVYDMVVPTSVGITLPDNKEDKVGSSDQKSSIHKIYKKIKQPVIAVDLYDTLMQHRTEYIYYRTDHHWTALGAYYAYQQFCETTGRTPHALSEYRKESFGGFIGTFYGDSNQNQALRKDKVKAYYPLGRHISMKVQTDSGKMAGGHVIEDASGYGISAKYCAFLGGDNAYSVITNKDIQDDSACIVVKESFGNAWVPYLTDHYHKIYVVDYRYWTGKLSALVKEKKAKDIIFINNISMTRNSYLVGQLSRVIH